MKERHFKVDMTERTVDVIQKPRIQDVIVLADNNELDISLIDPHAEPERLEVKEIDID